MATTTIQNQVTYFKRYRMELDLVAPLPPVPSLPEEFAWAPWEERLLDAHADVKSRCFKDELDGVVFPNLSNRAGCERLMRDIANRIGFRPQSTCSSPTATTTSPPFRASAIALATGKSRTSASSPPTAASGSASPFSCKHCMAFA
jgi:hypothetical protein